MAKFSWFDPAKCASLPIMKFRRWLMMLGFVLCAFLGYWLASTAAPDKLSRESKDTQIAAPKNNAPIDEPAPKFRRAERPPITYRDIDAKMLGAQEGERVLVFADDAAMRRFLEKLGNGVDLLGRLDALNALRVGFSNYEDLAALLDGSEELSFVFPLSTPPLPEGSVQSGAEALGGGLIEWLGIEGDHSRAGTGVRIAILDTGVATHPAFQSMIRSINLVELPADLATMNGHGTAVASMIIGNGHFTPGVAPGSEIISVRIADDYGQSNTFLIAQGIIAAVDAGANLINISMSGSSSSSVLNHAIEYALERGTLIFAPSGNNGIGKVSYPAASNGVIAVGAVDASGNHLAFSNSGDPLAISAPGYGVNAAWTGGTAAAVTGTSFSSPIVVGTVAHMMTESGSGTIQPWQAWEKVSTNVKDGGAAGQDPYLGAGMPDIGMAKNAGKRGIYDAAVASQRILPPDHSNPYGQMEILVQNRGTENLINTSVYVSTGGYPSTHNITTLGPGAVAVVRTPITRPPTEGSADLRVNSQVSLSGGIVDSKPRNDKRAERYAPTAAP